MLLDKLSMDKRDSDGFFLRRLACRTNDRSYNLTDSSLITVDYQQSLLAFAKLLIRHVHGLAAYYVIACNCTCAFLWLLSMSIVYAVASSSTVVQDLHNHHTALGWVACKRAEGFAQECFIC